MREVRDEWERLNFTARMKGSHTLGRGRKGKKEYAHTHKTTVKQGHPASLVAGALCEMARYRMNLHAAFLMNKLLIGCI